MRLLILSDANGTTTSALIRAVLGLARRRPDVVVCGIATGRPEVFDPPAATLARRAARRALVRATSRRMPFEAGEPLGHEVRRAAARAGVPVIVPPGGEVNDPAFVERVARELRPDAGLSFYCHQLIRGPLIEACGGIVNYHDGALPAYRGLNATPFSLYAGDALTGFTFHWIDEGLDTGDVLLEGAVPADPAAGLAEIVRLKARAAAAAVPRVLEMVAAGEPGRPQAGAPGYHSGAEGRDLRRVDDPGRLTADDLLRRVRAFGLVEMAIDGALRPVTRLRPAAPGTHLAFRTADGATLAADRLVGLPPRLRPRGR